MLEEKFSPCIKDFENKYKNILSIENYQFNIHEFVKPKLKKKKFHTFCLYIKAKVLPNNEYFLNYGLTDSNNDKVDDRGAVRFYHISIIDLSNKVYFNLKNRKEIL